MKTYEVKAWVTVEASSEADAVEKAAALLDLLPSGSVGSVSIEGEGAVYEVEDE